MDRYDAVWAKPTESYWIASTPACRYPALTADLTVDVAIVGAGIAGITTAYLLRNEGLKVALIEAETLAAGVSGHTTAKISSQHRLIYSRMMRLMGRGLAQQYAEANEAAIRLIKKHVAEHAIACDLSSQSAYVYTEKEEHRKEIEEEVKAAQSLGIEAHFCESLDLPLAVRGAVRFDGQAQFHPRSYLLSLAREFARCNGLVFERSRIVRFEQGKHHRLHTQDGGSVTATTVVMATNCPVDGKAMFYSLRMYPSRSYIVALRTKEAFPGGMYLRLEYPGRSLRAQPDGNEELVLIGGENHKTGQGIDTRKHFCHLTNFADELFTVETIPYRWSTQDYKTVDGVPYVGFYSSRSEDKLVATGFGKWGMTNGTAAGMILRDLIIAGQSPWQDVYHPSRKTIRASARRFVAEGLNVTGTIIREHITARPHSIQLAPGHGGVFQSDGKRIGAYRDEEGRMHLVNTTCTHMGCQLNWNAAEKSWDCPCHGGRFTYQGDVIQGPVVRPLKKIEASTLKQA